MMQLEAGTWYLNYCLAFNLLLRVLKEKTRFLAILDLTQQSVQCTAAFCAGANY